MLKYLIILLDEKSISFCHYQNTKKENKLISKEDLKAGILFAMKENLNIQFVYPDYDLPLEYKEIINTIDHSTIKPVGFADADVLVCNSVVEFCNQELDNEQVYVLRTNKQDFFANVNRLKENFYKCKRTNIVFTDIDAFSENDLDKYKEVLQDFASEIEKQIRKGEFSQVNILTDRMMLKEMNNCNAGVENITLAPNGNFYICPAFYYENEKEDIGSVEYGLEIKNAQLYQINHSPLCRICDCYHCKRCVWLNRKTTFEVNIPSHEQCVISHHERNTARDLQINTQLFDNEIKEIDYLDPFDVREQW